MDIDNLMDEEMKDNTESNQNYYNNHNHNHHRSQNFNDSMDSSDDEQTVIMSDSSQNGRDEIFEFNLNNQQISIHGMHGSLYYISSNTNSVNLGISFTGFYNKKVTKQILLFQKSNRADSDCYLIKTIKKKKNDNKVQLRNIQIFKNGSYRYWNIDGNYEYFQLFAIIAPQKQSIFQKNLNQSIKFSLLKQRVESNAKHSFSNVLAISTNYLTNSGLILSPLFYV